MIRPAHPRFSIDGDEQVRDLTCANSKPESLHDPSPEKDDEMVNKIKRLPVGVGIILMGVGIAGVILPGPIGAPLCLAGGLVLAPNVFGKLDKYMKEHLPAFRHHSVHAVDRFITDLEKRFPSNQE